MSCCSSSCCCCCVTPSGELLEGIRKKEQLVRGEEEEQEEEESRRNISVLREQYRCSRERQKRHTQVLLFRKVSEDLSEAVRIIPVTQGLTSPWKPSSSSPPTVTFDPSTSDPWHVYPETTSGSSRRSWSSSESRGRRVCVDSTPDPPRSSKEEDHLNTDGSRGDPDTGSSERSRGDSSRCSQMDPDQVSVSGPLDTLKQNPSDGSKEDHPDGPFSDSQECSFSSGESSTSVASITCSPSSSTTSLHEDLKENQSADRKTSNRVLQTSSTSVWRSSRKFSAPALRFTRQLSAGSSTGVHQNQNHHPFPKRKTPRISEAARRLGMYSSF